MPVASARRATTPARADRLDKRDLLLRAAIDTFAARGFFNAQVADVARAAGVAAGTVYLYFRGKDDLLISSRYRNVLPGLFPWHGGSIPTGTVQWTTAADEMDGPAAFESSTTTIWAGDLDGDGLQDVVWADAMYLNVSIPNQTGAIQVLY